MRKLIDRFIIFAFRPYLEQANFEVVKVRGWGAFLVEGKGIPRMTVWYEWWRGFI